VIIKEKEGLTVIRILFRQQLDNKEFAEKRKITMKEVSEKTGISSATLNRIANVPGYRTNTETIDALCAYFRCQPGDILNWLPD